jgi:hypothetical protein
MPESITELKSAIEGLYAASAPNDPAGARRLFAEFRARLTSGEIRAAEKIVNGNGESRWTTNA